VPDIVVTEFMDEAAVRDLATEFDVLYDATLVDRTDELRSLAASCRALIVRNRTQVRGELLTAATRLQAVGRLGVGLDNIDVEACKTRNIAVLPATGANDVSVAEYVITGVLVLLRGAYHSSAEVAAGKWPRNKLIGREIGGRRLGLIGFGGIARETAKRAAALGMEAVAYDPYLPADHPAWNQIGVRRTPLDELLATSDAVSLHVPLTPDTRNLIDAAALGRMPNHAVLVNAARGGVVEEAALARALRENRLGGAMLDVFESEPLPAGSVLEGVPNLILTPHIAGVTEESNTRVSAVTAANIRKVLKERA
jgi:(S)-sulfolactate dehydrogenase